MDIKEEDTTRVRTVRRLRRNIVNALVRWVLSALDSVRGWGARRAQRTPMIVACQWKRSSPFGPALQLDGGSRLISASSCGTRAPPD